ncbi:hypothetical protein G3I20_16705, partial [Streptomyces sp. SID8111]|uniref:hypothetical protein n=1 Tax=Streptomyces sp. SID8111 TaxID=2706100 RepID=UPI0013BF7D08
AADAPAATDGTGPGDTARLWREEPLLSRPAPHREGGAAGLDLEARALVAPRTVTTLQKQADVTLTVTWHLRLDLDAPAAARFAGERGRAELARLLSAYPDDARMAHCGERAAYGGMYCPVGPHPGSALEDTTRLSGVLTAFGAQWNQARTIISFGLASLLAVGLLTVVVTASLAVRRGLGTLRLRRARGASATGL